MGVSVLSPDAEFAEGMRNPIDIHGRPWLVSGRIDPSGSKYVEMWFMDTVDAVHTARQLRFSGVLQTHESGDRRPKYVKI